MPIVKMLVSLAAANFSYAPGDKILVNNEVAEEWIRIGHATAYEEQPATKLADLSQDSAPDPEPEVPITVDQFTELKADDQKALLKNLEIEGDDGNADKRVALYESYLQKVGDPDGSQTGNSAGDGAGEPAGD